MLLGPSRQSSHGGSTMASTIPFLPGAEVNSQHRAILQISVLIHVLHLLIEESLNG